MNKYLHLAAWLTSMSSFGCLTVAIANEQNSLNYGNPTLNNIKPTDRSLKLSPAEAFGDRSNTLAIAPDNAHHELNEIARTSLVTEILAGKLKAKTPKVKKRSQTVVSATTLAMVKEAEGFRSSAYIDTDGTPVIGYGQSKINGKKVRMGDRITPQAAEIALKQDLAVIQQELSSSIKVELNSNQLGALTSLAFNTGVSAIKNSTLVRKLNQKDYSGAANEFLRWHKANIRGELIRMEGLVKRRHRERNLFLTPVNSVSESALDRTVTVLPIL